MIVTGVLAGIVVALLLSGAFILFKKERPLPVSRDGEGLRLRASPPTSPITKVSFEEALWAGGLEREIDDYSKKLMGFALGFDAANVVIQGVALSDGEMSITWSFTKEGVRKLHNKVAYIPLEHGSGHLLPILSESKTHKFIEQAKGTINHAGRFAEISATVVSIAHIISNADMVRQLGRVNHKLDLLLAGRMIDQKSELAMIYQNARECLSGTVTEDGRSKMRDWRGHLFRLRTVWRDEIEKTLESAPDPNSRKWNDSGTWFSKTRGQRTNEHLVGIGEKVRLSMLSLLVDLCLAHETETIDKFITVTVRDESKLWSDPVAKLNALSRKTRPGDGKKVQTLAGACQGYHDALCGLSYTRNDAK
jgi:hypothetical protein